MYTNKLVFCLYKLIFKLVLGKEAGFVIGLFFKENNLFKKDITFTRINTLFQKAISYPDIAFYFLETYDCSRYHKVNKNPENIITRSNKRPCSYSWINSSFV